MRFFGLYFGMFSTIFHFLLRRDFLDALLFGSTVLFYYFVFTTALSSAFVVAIYAAFKKGIDVIFKFSPFNGLLAGSVGTFVLNFISNRIALLFGSHFLFKGLSNNDYALIGFGVTLVVLGYTLFRPFNFDFIGGTDSFKKTYKPFDETVIDVDVMESDKRGIGRN